MSETRDTEPGRDPPQPTPAQQLWQRWRQGEQPDVTAFLAGASRLEPAQVAAVLLVDQRERWRLGDRTPAETYLRMFPALRDNFEYGLELVYGEFLLAEERNDAPDLDDYRQRFPVFAERLKLQVELHRAMARTPEAISSEIEFLPPATGIVVTEAQPAWPDIPGYEVLEELGRGGM